MSLALKACHTWVITSNMQEKSREYIGTQVDGCYFIGFKKLHQKNQYSSICSSWA